MSILKIVLEKWYVLVGFVLAGVLLGVVSEKDEYQSEASLMFKLGREHLYQPEFGNRQPIASTRSDLANAINTETHIMSSADVLRMAVQQVGAINILPASSLAEGASDELVEQSAVDVLADELSIRSIEGTNVVQLKLNQQNPEVARNTLNAIIDAFLQHRKEIYGDSSLQLMQAKLSENRSALLKAEEDLQKFSAEQNIYAYKDQLSSITEQLIVADRNRQNLSAEKSEVEDQLKSTTERISATAPSVSLYTDTATNSLYEETKSRIFALQMERNQLRGKYHDSSERVTQIMSEIAQLEKSVKTLNRFTTSNERKGRNPALDSLISRKIELGNKRDAIIGRHKSQADLISSLQQKRRELNALGTQFEQRQSAVDVLKERQLTYIDEVYKAKLANDINNNVRSGARVLQRASLPTDKAGITGIARMKLAALVGLLFAIALLMAKSIFSTLRIIPESEGKVVASDVGQRLIQSGNSDGTVRSRPRDQQSVNTPENDLPGRDNEAKKIGGVTVLGKIVRA